MGTIHPRNTIGIEGKRRLSKQDNFILFPISPEGYKEYHRGSIC